MSHVEHKRYASEIINCYILTLSDTRDEEADQSGQLIQKILEEHSHNIVGYNVLRESPERLEEVLLELKQEGAIEAILLTGGTGLSRRDSTYEIVTRVIEKEITGFGELFRWLSYQEIGSAAMLSRAVAGVMGDKVVMALPGSPQAVQTAMEKLILPELPHLVYEINK